MDALATCNGCDAAPMVDGDPRGYCEACAESAMTNRERFTDAYLKAIRNRFATDPDYAYSAERITPEALTARMVPGIIDGTANKSGGACRDACRALGIKDTYKAIREFCSDG